MKYNICMKITQSYGVKFKGGYKAIKRTIVIFNEAVRNMIPSNVLEPSFLPRILKANKNKGISKAIFIIQMGMPVKVLIIIETPVSPPGAIL